MKQPDNQPCIKTDLLSAELIDAKTGFKPLTDAILAAHEDPKPRHFINECNLINRVVTGMDPKKFKEEKGVDSVRDALSIDDLRRMLDLQLYDAALIKSGFCYKDRKELLIRFNNNALEKAA
jgi:hypothetical protein